MRANKYWKQGKMRGELFSPLEVLNDLFAELLTMQTRPHKATVIARCSMQAPQI